MKLSEKICQNVEKVLLKTKLVYNNGVDESISNYDEYMKQYVEWEGERADKTFGKFSQFVDLNGKNVLDLGCGYGGKTIKYAQMGSGRVIGIDIIEKNVKKGKECLDNENGYSNKVDFILGNAIVLPFKSECFDIIFINETMEHLDKPLEVLQECKRVLKINGAICIDFEPYYNPMGSHLYSIIKIPWVNVLFSDKTLINVIIEKIKEGSVYQRFYTNEEEKEKLLNTWRRKKEIDVTNKMTIRKFKHLLKKSRLKVVHFKLSGLSNYGIKEKNHIRTLRIFDLLVYLPMVRELFTYNVETVLQKTAS